MIYGLKVNLSKTSLVGLNVESKVDAMAHLWGCTVGEWPLGHLGMPVGGDPRKQSFWV